MKITAPPDKAAVWMAGACGNEIKGGGSACRVITGEIYDKDGTIIGHFDPMILDAVGDWEKLLVEFGVNLDNQS